MRNGTPFSYAMFRYFGWYEKITHFNLCQKFLQILKKKHADFKIIQYVDNAYINNTFVEFIL